MHILSSMYYESIPVVAFNTFFHFFFVLSIYYFGKSGMRVPSDWYSWGLMWSHVVLRFTIIYLLSQGLVAIVPVLFARLGYSSCRFHWVVLHRLHLSFPLISPLHTWLGGLKHLHVYLQPSPGFTWDNDAHILGLCLLFPFQLIPRISWDGGFRIVGSSAPPVSILGHRNVAICRRWSRPCRRLAFWRMCIWRLGACIGASIFASKLPWNLGGVVSSGGCSTHETGICCFCCFCGREDWWVFPGYPLVNIQKAIENCHL